MKQAKLIEWPGDKDEWIFASHTSLISSDLIKNELNIDHSHHDHAHSHSHDKLNRSKTKIEKQNELLSRTLDLESDEQSKYKRISIEAIDFDWIFTG